MSEQTTQSNVLKFDSRPKDANIAEAPQAQPQTLDDPLIREITPGDLANPMVLGTVVTMFKAAPGGEPDPPDHEIIARLNTGALRAYWVLSQAGQHAGVITFETGAEGAQRIMYISSATVAPHVSDAGWRRLFEFGCVVAREHACDCLQFDVLPVNERVVEIARLIGAAESEGPAGMRRFTVKV